MVSFRKWFPALAIVALLLGSAVAASAQTAFTCQNTTGVPPTVRGEGLTELVGDIVLQCTGGNTTAAGAPVPGVNISVFLNTFITSRVLSADVSEALLLIDEPTTLKPCITGIATCRDTTVGTGAPGIPSNTDPTNGYGVGSPVPGGINYRTGANYNAFYGRHVQQTSNGTVYQEYISWAGVPIDAPGTIGVRTIRITNLRANANYLGVGSTFAPVSIVAFISITSTQSISLNNPTQTVAFVIKGLGNFTTVADPNPPSLLGCIGNPFNEETTITTRARFTEGFASSFKRQFQGGYSEASANFNGIGLAALPRPLATGGASWPGQAPYAEQRVPGQNTFSESGFVANAVPGSGVADSGTRFILRFANIPAGVTVYAGSVDANAINPGTGAYSGLWARARLVTGADANGAGGSVISAPTSIPSGTPWPTVKVPTSNTLVYEIVASDASVIESIDIPIFVSFAGNKGINTGTPLPTVSGSLAPVSTVGTETVPRPSDATDFPPIPRFKDSAAVKDLFQILPCRTNILFPFVSADNGFDTGIAISNTSKAPSPIGSAQQSGNCTINYFGTTTGGGAAPNAQTTTSVIDPGTTLTFVVSTGGTNGIAGTPGFQGYIIAQCDFQYAHGFAFITDGPIGSARVAEGYLGLIMDSPLSSRSKSSSESLNQ